MNDPVAREPAPHLPVAKPGWYLDAPSGRQRWWDGQAWTDSWGPIVHYKPTSHVFHLLMSIITLGLWIPVWIIIGLTNRPPR